MIFGSDPVGESAARRKSGNCARCPGLGGRLRALGIGNDLGSGCPPGVAECRLGGSLPAYWSGSVIGSMGDQAELVCPGTTGGNGCAGVDTGLAVGPGDLGGGLHGCATVGMPFGMTRVTCEAALHSAVVRSMGEPDFPVLWQMGRLTSTVVEVGTPSPPPGPAGQVSTASWASGSSPVTARKLCNPWLTGSGCGPAVPRYLSEMGICSASVPSMDCQRA